MLRVRRLALGIALLLVSVPALALVKGWRPEALLGTVPSATSSIDYTGNGVTTAFPVPFYFQSSSHLTVKTILAGTTTTLALGSGYAVSGEGAASGGTVTTTAPPASGATVRIERVVPLTQTVAFRTQGKFTPKLHEDALDKLTMGLQQVRRDVSDLEANEFAVRSVKAYGATGDGATDDTSSVDAAASVSTPGVIYFPPGTYMMSGNGLLIKAPSGSVYRGAGRDLVTIRSKSTIGNWLSQTSSAYPRQNITFEDMTFDTDAKGVGLFAIYGEHVQGLTFRRCRFLFKSTLGLSFNGVANVTIEDSEFHGYATASTALSIGGGSTHFTIRNNRFRYAQSHIIVDTGVSSSAEVEDLTEYLTIEGNDFDMGWWLWPSTKSSSGGTVTYSGNAGVVPPTGTLTDSGGGLNTAGLVQYDTKRVLVVNDTGEFETITNQYVEDTAGGLSDSKRGEIIRTTGKFAVISGVKSATVLRIEEWLDSSTYLPTSPPAAGTSFTSYKLYHFVVDSWNDTSITTYSGFWDNDGAAIVPANGSRYELYARPNYNIHIEYAAGQVRVLNNKVRRGWSDQVSIYSNRAVITGNLVEDGEDMGITLNGTPGVGNSIVANNKVRHQGATGIFIGPTTGTVVSGNQLDRNTWVNQHNLFTLGGIQLVGATDVLVIGNVIDGASRTLTRCGIGVHSTSGGVNDKITLAHNQVRGVSVAGIVIHNDGDNGTNIQLRSNRASISYSGGHPGMYSEMLLHSDLSETGTPEGSVTAAPASTFVGDDGKLYIKTSGTGNTNWVVAGTQT